MGWSLIQVGQQSKNNAMHSLADLSRQEQQRENTNEQLDNQHKQNIVGGAATGASIGMMAGPIGAAVGAVVGGLAGANF